MGCGMSMVKYILFLFNLLCAIFGLVLCFYAGRELWRYNDIQDDNQLYGAIIMLVLGLLIFNISWYGCCGAIRESYCMTMTYAISMFILLIIQLVVIIFLFVSKPEDYMEDRLKQIEDEWSISKHDGSATDKLIEIQKEYQCCGRNSMYDYNNLTRALPQSCCAEEGIICPKPAAFKKGCLEAYSEHFENVYAGLKYFAIGIGVIEFFGLAACWCAGKLFHETYGSGGSYTIPICFTILGIFVLLISVFGCCAIWKEHYKITISYLVLMIVLFILQLVIIVIIFLYKEDIIEGLQKTVDEAWNDSTAEGSPTPFLDDLQQHYKCCGKNSPKDYNLLIPIPKSCCDSSANICTAWNAYKMGCKSAYTGWIDDNYNILKYIAIGIGVVEICGILIIAFGAVILSSSIKSFEDFKDAFSHNSLPIGLIVLGAVIFIIAFYGCCGAIRESYCMSMTYSVFLFILLIVQIAVLVYAFIAKDEYLKQMGVFVDRVWEKTESTRQPSYMDALQLGWKCCGKTAVTDYNIFTQVPKSCCDVGVDNCNVLNSYKVGCRYEFVNWWDRKWDLMKYVGIGIALIELVGFIFACCLANNVRNDRRRSAY